MATKKHKKVFSAVVHFSEISAKKIVLLQKQYKDKKINVSVDFVANQIIETAR